MQAKQKLNGGRPSERMNQRLVRYEGRFETNLGFSKYCKFSRFFNQIL